MIRANPKRPIRLYLVDDHEIMRDGLKMLLDSVGYDVVGQSTNFTLVLAEIQELDADVVLLELELLQRSGLELLSEMQHRKVRAKSVVLTSLPQPRLVEEALRLGALGYVLKASGVHELSAVINSAAEGKRRLSPEVANLAIQSLTSGANSNPFMDLAPRERQIVSMVADGNSSASIGKFLHLSPKTVATYRCRLMSKLGLTDLPALVRLTIRHKLHEMNALPMD